MTTVVAIPSIPEIPADRIQDDFERFHSRHPEVFRKFLTLAITMRASGKTRYSSDALLHVIRWHYDLELGNEAPMLNNNYSSRYARLAMQTDPLLVEFFELRKLKRAA